jgi:LPS export ABC transporter protein LptC
MKFFKFSKLFINAYLVVMIMLIAGTLISCDKSIDLVQKTDLTKIPSGTAKDFETVFSDSGKIQLIMTAPILEQYDNVEVPFTEFNAGIKILFYDGNKDPIGSVTSKYARFTESKNLWELRDSVIVENENDEKLETELLFWNQQKDLIYTDRFVKISTKDQISRGTGFESDSRLNKRRIKKSSATIYLNDEE